MKKIICFLTVSGILFAFTPVYAMPNHNNHDIHYNHGYQMEKSINSLEQNYHRPEEYKHSCNRGEKIVAGATIGAIFGVILGAVLN